MVAVLTMMLAFPVGAQISSDSETQNTGTDGAAILINIDKTKQQMTVFLNGEHWALEGCILPDPENFVASRGRRAAIGTTDRIASCNQRLGVAEA